MTELNFDLEQIKSELDRELRLQKRIEKSVNFAKTILYILKVTNDKHKIYITVSELSEFLSRPRNYVYSLLEELCTYGVLKKIPGEKANRYVLIDRAILLNYLDLAKRTVGLNE